MRKFGHIATIEANFSPVRKTAGMKIAEQVKQDLKIPDTIVLSPDKVYSKVRAISARVNLNADGFRKEEILGSVEGHEPHNEKYGYRTFIGKNNHIDHFNQPDLADEEPKHTPRGKLLWASYHEDPYEPVYMDGFPDSGAKSIEDPIAKMAGADSWVELLIENDRQKFPVLCEAIEKGFITKVSMGAEIINSSCSVCGNVAQHEFQFCDHTRFGRGNVYPAQKNSPLVRMGSLQPGDPVLAFEDNHGLQFFEESWILDVQADPTAVLLDLVKNEAQMNRTEAKAAAAQVAKVAHSLQTKIAVETEEEKPSVNLQIDNVEEYVKSQEPEEEGEQPEMDYSQPPHLQQGEFYPDYPFPCSARWSASRANPDYPIDDTIDVEVCQGCMYNLSDRVGAVDCRFDEVVREGGKDPLPPGFEDPNSSAKSERGSGFQNQDGTEIDEFPGLDHPPGPR